MTGAYHWQHAREVVAEQLAFLQKKNPRFSLRALARLLELSPSYVSQVIDGKRHLSLEQGQEVAERLKFDDDYAKFFLTLVELGTASPRARVLLKRRLASLRARADSRKVSPTVELAGIGWLHLMTLAAVDRQDGLSDRGRRGLAAFAGVAAGELEEAIRDLVRAGLLVETASGLERTERQLVLEAKGRNSTVREIHSTYLDRVRKHLRNRDPEGRFSATEFYAVPAAQAERIKERAEEFLDEIASLCHEAEATGEINDAILEVALHLNFGAPPN